MEKLALTIDGIGEKTLNDDGTTTQQTIIQSPTKSSFTDLGSTLSAFYGVIFYIAFFLVLIWLVWGIFQYLFAGGNKEGLAKARGRITWAIVGFVILVIAFFVSDLLKGILIK